MKPKRILVLSFLIAICLPSFASAQQTNIAPGSSLSLSVSPGLTETIISPGKTQSVSVHVTNTSNMTLPVSAKLHKFETVEGIADKDRQRFDSSKWFKITEPEFILQPRQTRVVKMTITAPPDVEPGGHYATLYLQPHVPAQTLKQNSAQIGARVGVLMLLVVKGNLIEDTSIKSFTTSNIHQSGPINFDLTLKNSGNVHIMPTGHIEVLDWQNKLVGNIPLPVSLVLPKTERTIRLAWDNTNRIGKFTARPIVNYGTRTKTLDSQTVTFWVVPWLSTLFWLLLIAIGGGLVYRSRGRWNRALRALRGKQDKTPLKHRKIVKKR